MSAELAGEAACQSPGPIIASSSDHCLRLGAWQYEPGRPHVPLGASEASIAALPGCSGLLGLSHPHSLAGVITPTLPGSQGSFPEPAAQARCSLVLADLRRTAGRRVALQ
ncbi:hypothetical protein CVIRNUC_009395 [Coccomyxa viridis]|uniref:Uncharacterized protein n=1 Tax=Coccomyxa viridis TaxID=1274662 RepID=A0AAV1IGA9_9CHLO|nr:hypothetical protein CVIRNUC_009395 [Coccomyxa viridis]